MTTILVIGATGQVGQQVCRKLLDRGYKVRALVRDFQRAQELQHPNLEVIYSDLEDDFSEAYDGVSKVVFVAGSGSLTGCSKTLLVDLWATKRAIDYAEEEPTVEHFIQLSSFGADDPEEVTSDIKPYLIAKHITDEYLTNTCLPYTILRPTALTNATSSGGLSCERPRNPNDQDLQVSRIDLADVICYCVENNHTKVKVIELFKGDKSIETLLK